VKKFGEVREWGINGIYQNGLQKALSPNLPHSGFLDAANWGEKIEKPPFSM
jgi:hypothetical protein